MPLRTTHRNARRITASSHGCHAMKRMPVVMKLSGVSGSVARIRRISSQGSSRWKRTAFTSSTHMAVSVRFHREDPWERIRLMSAAMPHTPLGMIGTGMRFISWVPADEDVIRLSFRLVARNGIRRFQIADPSNDPSRLRRLARMARQEGIEEVVIGLTYSISAVHTHEYYAERAA